MAKFNYVTGTGNWMKILGSPVPNYNRDGNEWTFDFTPDKESMKTLLDLGLKDKMKNKGDDRKDFIVFKQKEERADGEKNRPIGVYDALNRPWNPDTKIGNGSTVEVKFRVADYGAGKPKGVYPQAVRVLELVPYVPQEFAPLPEDNEFAKKAEEFNPVATPDFEKDFGLDDEVPNFEE